MASYRLYLQKDTQPSQKFVAGVNSWVLKVGHRQPDDPVAVTGAVIAGMLENRSRCFTGRVF